LVKGGVEPFWRGTQGGLYIDPGAGPDLSKKKKKEERYRNAILEKNLKGEKNRKG